MLLCDSKDAVNHCYILLSFFLDIPLGVTLLEVNELIRCCYGVAFRKLEIELAHVNRIYEASR